MGCLTAQTASENPAVPEDVRAEDHAVFAECCSALTAALTAEPEPNALPPLPVPDAPLPETPLREPPTAPVQQRSPVFMEPQSPLQQPVLQPLQATKPPAPDTALPAPLPAPLIMPPSPASGSTPATGSTPPPPSPPTLATGQPVPM